MIERPRRASRKTTASRQFAVTALLLALALAAGCAAGKPAEPHGEEEEALSRTEFTSRIENFFEYDPLVAGKPSQFLIHLTDLSDGTPIEKADVSLVVRSSAGAAVAETKAKVGKVTGIYVAELDERMPLTGFDVGAAR